MAIAVIWGASACANWFFGGSLGDSTPVDMLLFETTTSKIFSGVSIASDVLKTVMLFAAAAAVAHKRWRPALVCSIIWLACVGWSLASAVGFVALNHSTVTDNRGKTADNWSELRDEMARKQERRKWIPEHRPAAAVQAEIIGSEGQFLYIRTKQCSDITAADSIAFCDNLAKLRQEFFNAEESAKLDTELDALRKEMQRTSRMTSATPFADMVGGIIGIGAAGITTGQALFLAFLLELISGPGLWAVWSSALARPERRIAAPQPRKDLEPHPYWKELKPAPAPAMEAVEPGSGAGGGIAPTEVAKATAPFAPPAVKLPVEQIRTLTLVHNSDDDSVFDLPSEPPAKGRTSKKSPARTGPKKECAVSDWVSDRATLTGNKKDSVLVKDCWKSYLELCEIISKKPLGRHKFARALNVITGQITEDGNRSPRNGKGNIVFGIILDERQMAVQRRA
jgi:hypothetical protein